MDIRRSEHDTALVQLIGRNSILRKILMIAGLISIGTFSPSAFAEQFEDCSGKYNNCTRNGTASDSHEALCNKLEHACERRNIDKGAKSRTDIAGDGRVGKAPKDSKDAKQDATWNGQYTNVVVTDSTGTHTYRVKQGVPIENGQLILAPNG